MRSLKARYVGVVCAMVLTLATFFGAAQVPASAGPSPAASDLRQRNLMRGASDAPELAIKIGISERSFFFASADGQFTALVQTEAQAAIARSLGIEAKIGPRSYADLTKLRETAAGLLKAQGLTTSANLAIDPEQDLVVVLAGDDVMKHDVVAQLTAVDGVVVTPDNEAGNPAKPAEDVAGGLSWRSSGGGHHCTIGFPTSDGEFFFTAGHCATPLGSHVYNGGMTWIGKTYSSHLKTNGWDLGLVDLGAVSVKKGYVANWAGGYKRVSGVSWPFNGMPVCKYGAALQAQSCGAVIAADVYYNLVMSPTVTYTNVSGARISGCSIPGDSGAPVLYTSSAAASGEGVGVVSSGSSSCSPPGIYYAGSLALAQYQYGKTAAIVP